MPLASINIFSLKQIRTGRRRYDLEDCQITCPRVCYKVLQFTLDLKFEPIEKFGIISLNTRSRIVGIHIIGTGSIDKLYIEPREVFMAAMDEAHTMYAMPKRSSHFITTRRVVPNRAGMIFL